MIIAAKRARQINSYHHQLGEGMGFEEAPPPLVQSRSKNYLTMALEEVAQAKIDYAYQRSHAQPVRTRTRSRQYRRRSLTAQYDRGPNRARHHRRHRGL